METTPSKGDLAPLGQEDVEKILGLVGVEDEQQSQVVLSRIELARVFFRDLRDTDADHFNTRAVRDSAASELRMLGTEVARLRERLDQLGPLATAQLGRVELKEPKSWDGSLAYPLSYRGREWIVSRSDALAVFELLLDMIESWTDEEQEWLKGPLRSGPRRDFSGGVLVEQIASIWQESTSQPIRRDLRGKADQTQPFNELVKIVGRSVDPAFVGTGAVRRFYESRLQDADRE
jgi:hypothetical protein